MGPLTAELRDMLLLSLQGEERARCLAIAGICVLVYDMALTFADEVSATCVFEEVSAGLSMVRWSTFGRARGRFRGYYFLS